MCLGRILTALRCHQLIRNSRRPPDILNRALPVIDH